MGYRQLLKKYIRHLLRTAGDDYIVVAGESEVLSKRDLAELRLLAAEVERDEHRPNRLGMTDQADGEPKVPRRPRA